MPLAPSFARIQYSGIFLEYSEYMDLGITDITTRKTEQLDLKVINNVDSWDFRAERDHVKFFCS